MVKAVTAICHRGTSAFAAAAVPVDHAEYMAAQTPTALPTSLAPCANEAVQAVMICTKEYRYSTSFWYLVAWA
jgi:hypothetical protein